MNQINIRFESEKNTKSKSHMEKSNLDSDNLEIENSGPPGPKIKIQNRNKDSHLAFEK